MLSPRSAADAGARAHPQSGVTVPDPSPPAGAVSWGAILAGAAAAAALSLILLLLGTGLGLSGLSPWSGRGASPTAFGVAAIAWVVVTQLMASGMGGYLAGRLRTRWAGVDPDEVHFRDTAHGFLAWGVATIATAALLASALGSAAEAGAKVGATAAGSAVALAAPAAKLGAGQASPGEDPASAYLIDGLFRADPAKPLAAGSADAEGRVPPELPRILLNGLRTGVLPPEDTHYLGQWVAVRAGISPADAERRVTDVFTRLQAQVRETETSLRAAADRARKVSIQAALWIFISLLAGAFTASLAATVGGRQRDL